MVDIEPRGKSYRIHVQFHSTVAGYFQYLTDADGIGL